MANENLCLTNGAQGNEARRNAALGDLLGQIQNAGVPQAAPIVRPVRLNMPPDLTYSGREAEDYDLWLQRVNDQGVMEGWNDDNKRTAASLTLRENARRWHQDFGAAYPEWVQWEEALSRYFITPMDETEWRLRIEGLKQLLNEPSRDYILKKNALFRKRPTQTAEAVRINFLIRGGLYNTEVKIAVSAINLLTVADFVEAVRQKEKTFNCPFKDSVLTVMATGTTGPTERKLELEEQLRQANRRYETLQRSIPAKSSPSGFQYKAPQEGRSGPVTPQIAAGSNMQTPSFVTGANATPLGNRGFQAPNGSQRDQTSTPINASFRDLTRRYPVRDNNCFKCGLPGHWRGECPNGQRDAGISGNGQAGSQGQANRQ